MKLKVWPLVKNLIALIESQEEELLSMQEEIADLLITVAKLKEESGALAQVLAHDKTRGANDLRPWKDGVPWGSLEGEE